jgi:hypothetical protein
MVGPVERGPVVLLALPFRYQYEINLLAQLCPAGPGHPMDAPCGVRVARGTAPNPPCRGAGALMALGDHSRQWRRPVTWAHSGRATASSRSTAIGGHVMSVRRSGEVAVHRPDLANNPNDKV